MGSPQHPESPSPLGRVPDTTADVGPAETAAERRERDLRRRFDRGGRRRADWPDDAGLTCCPGCGHETLQSLGALDSGEYLWACPHCDRQFRTSRASRVML